MPTFNNRSPINSSIESKGETLTQDKILIVDDNPTNLGVLFDFLSKAGLKVFVAIDGESAIHKALDICPHLILLDIMMPGLDGFETCQQLKAHESLQDIPVIFMTALTDTNDKVKGFQAGAVDYVTKPIQREEVLSRINTHLSLRKLNKELQEKNEKLASLNQNLERLIQVKTRQLIDQEKTAIIGRLTQGIVHNIRNHLQSLLGFSYFLIGLADESSNEKIVDYSRKINFSAKSIELIVDSLIQKVTFEQTPQIDPININKLLQRELQLLIANKQFNYQIQKQYEFDDSLPLLPISYADLSQVFMNLVKNAMDAMWGQEEQFLKIVTRQDTEQVYIDIQDTGCGISDEKLPHIFDPFYTSKPCLGGTEAGEEPTGTGLGLYTCLEIIKSLGGEIRVTSEVDRGSTFTIVLPKQMPLETN